jgi:hypothetical protein
VYSDTNTLNVTVTLFLVATIVIFLFVFGADFKVANGNGKAGPSASLVQKYMDMGFTEEIVLKAMKDNGT